VKRFNGLGFLVLILPVVLYIPIRAIAGEAVGTHRGIVFFIEFILSGALLFAIAALQDKKIGIDVLSPSAWTSRLLDSQHISFYIPLRLAGIIMVLGSFGALFIK